MPQETARKIVLSLLCIGMAIGSVVGIILGILCLAVSHDDCWLALIIGSILLFIGAVYGIFKFTFSKRAPKAEREKKSPRNTLIWVVVAFGSVAGAGLACLFRRELFPSIWWIFFIILALLAALFLYSIFVLISGGRRREEKSTNIISPIDDETNKSIDETIKKIEQND